MDQPLAGAALRAGSHLPEEHYQQYLHRNPYGYCCHASTGIPFPTER